MPFDPNLPEENATLSSEEMRGQLNSLRELIDTIPQGDPGADGPPGEVSQQNLDDAIAGTPSNVNGLSGLALTVSDPPTQAEMQAVADKLEELIGLLQRF